MQSEPLGKAFFFFALLFFGAKLWLLSAHYLQATVSPHDDLLFVRSAWEIIQGNWLGPYNQYTLIKGPFYPFFMAVSYWLAMPLLASQQILWAAAALVFVVALYPALKNQTLALAIFLFLLVAPFTYTEPTIRVFREGFYPTLGFMLLSCMLGLFLREKESLGKRLVWACGASIVFAAFWHTREESIWLVPSLLFLCAYHLWTIFHRYPSERKKKFTQVLIVYLAPLGIFFAVTLAFCYQNYRYYGLFTTVEIESSPFKSAYDGLLRIKTDSWRQYYPVVRAARMKAYEVSPAFRELQSYIEGEKGQAWTKLNRSDDLPAAFFIWIFRDAVAAAGYYKDGGSAMEFYSRMGKELRQACDDGRLQCQPIFASLVPPWNEAYNKLFIPTFAEIFSRIVRFNELSADTDNMYSYAPGEIMGLYAAVTREKIRTSMPRQERQLVPKRHLHLEYEKIRILNNITHGYSAIVPPLFFVACACFLASLCVSVYKRRLPSWSMAFAAASLGGILSLTVILTLLVITSYPEIGRAMQASYPMLLFFIIASLHEGWCLCARRRAEVTPDTYGRSSNNL